MLATVINNIAIPVATNFLILDDNQDIRLLLIDHLKELDFSGEFFEAKDLHQAQDIFNTEEIHYCLLDWTLPDGTGLNFLKALRKFDEYNSVPVLLITGSDQVDTIVDALQAGASDYIIKPWSIKDLNSKLAICWKKHIKAE